MKKRVFRLQPDLFDEGTHRWECLPQRNRKEVEVLLSQLIRAAFENAALIQTQEESHVSENKDASFQ